MEQALQIQAKYNGVNYNGEQYELVGFDELRIDLKNRLNKYNSLGKNIFIPILERFNVSEKDRKYFVTLRANRGKKGVLEYIFYT